jgi:hypothetical protein
MLIRAHALLHQASRLKDERGQVVATTEDYAAVRSLVAAVRSLVEDVVSEGVGSTVKPEVREVVQVTARLLKEGSTEVSQTQLRKALHLDRAVISRRVAAALDAGFLRNLEDRKGRPARLGLGDELPADSDVLPAPDKLDAQEVLRCCAVVQGGIHPPPLCVPRPWRTMSGRAYAPSVRPTGRHFSTRTQAFRTMASGFTKNAPDIARRGASHESPAGCVPAERRDQGR